jgi:hypothetical protein
MSGVIGGVLPAGNWTKVADGWGYYSVDYGISTGAGGGQYRCYTAPLPFPYSSGSLPNPRVTHRVIGYGSVWLSSPVATSFSLVPVGP